MKTLDAHSVSAFVLILAAGTLTSAGESDSSETTTRIVPEIRALRANPHPPAIDGDLEDPVWTGSDIQKVGGFIQTDPDEGKPQSESTFVAVVYDEKAIYAAFWCYDSEPEKITSQLARRDRLSQSDLVSIRLDPYHDHRSGYLFNVSAAGTQRDLRIYDNTNTDESWDGVWMAAVRRQPWGWSAEFEIPYHCLRFPELEEHVWGVDFTRWVARKNEFTQWAFVPSKEGGFASNFGHLTGLSDIQPTRHLEVLPYAVSSMESRPSVRWNDGRDLLGNAGMDIKYGLSTNLTLDATINPDFGQVELDQPVLNLSVFETYFPEKRPFFMEGADLFRTEFQMFYSRRIGRNPAYDVDDPAFFHEIHRPRASTILGAAKLTGKLAGRTSVAVLGAVTQRERARYAAIDSVFNVETDSVGDTTNADTTFAFRDGVVEPPAGYTVFRVKQDVLANSHVGAVVTLASQDTRHAAVTGGLDWRLFTNNSAWYVRGQSVFSRVDPEHVGFGLDLTLGKDAGKHVRGAVGITVKDPHFQINRLGFTERNNIRNTYLWMQYRTNDDWWIVRNSRNNVNFYYTENYAGAVITRGGNINFYIEFINNWSMGGGAEVQAEKYSDLETRGNGLWVWPGNPTYSWWFNVETDPRKKVSVLWNPGSGGDRGGSWWANYVGVNFRPQTNIEFSLGSNYVRNLGNTRWVRNISADQSTAPNAPDTSIFADLDKDQISLYASAGVVFHRNLSCQLSARGLISGLDYRNYRPYFGENQYGPYRYDLNHDFAFGSLNSTFLFRWEYRPGSTLYVVWTRSKSDYDPAANDLDLKRDLDRFFSVGSENLFLIKASYWFNL
ncbi:MAG: DUF5916 domain-containing protein [Candidatus Zixiibacteriota bacterium]